MKRRRVVVTGLGITHALGDSVDEVWNSIINGRSGVSLITRFDTSSYKCRIAAEHKEFDPTKWMTGREARRMDRFCHFALASAKQAVEDARLDPKWVDSERVGVILGSGIGGLFEMETQHSRLVDKGPERVSPFLIPKLMMNSAPGQVAIKYGFSGPNEAVATACASASHAIGEAFETIAVGEADVVLTGGSEAAVTPLGLAGFCSMNALSTRNEEPEKACRPFDKERDGFVMGEGGAVIVLEELEHALSRGARIYAEVLGFASNADAYHITAPQPDGRGAAECMANALEASRLNPEDISYINAHGTATELNDAMETKAIKKVFGERAYEIPVSSTKSMTGHLLGASGAVEMVFTVLAVKNNIVPPTINYENRDPECDLDYVPNESRPQEVNYALSNAFGFGGHNATIVVGKFR